MITRTSLSERIHALAESGHEKAEELRAKANAFDVATAGFYGDPQTVGVKPFMGAFARARRLWCECTGEPLI